MNRKGHPTRVDLAAHAQGRLALEADRVVLAHIAACDGCLAIVKSFEEAEGRALAAMEPAPMADDAVARCLALIALNKRS